MAKQFEPRLPDNDVQRRSDDDLRRLMEAVPAFITHTDREERYLYVNRAMAEFYGLQPEQMIGRTRREVLGDEVYEHIRPFVERALAGERVSYERYNTANGRTLALNLVPERDAQGRVIGLYGLHTDVTELKQAQEALAASEARFRALTQLSSDWFWEQDEEFRFTKFEGSSHGLVAFTEAYGKRRWELGFSVAGGWEAHKRVVEAHLPFRDLEITRYNPDGSVGAVASISGEPMFDSDGRFRGYRGVAKDVTERLRAEQELKRHRDHLEELVKERTAELIDARDRAEVASQAKSDFLARMSHELRTPLNAVLGYAQILQMERKLDDKVARSISTIRRSGEHLLALINDVLDLAKIEAGRLDLAPGPLELQPFLRVIGDITRVKAEEKGLSFVFDVSADLPKAVRADERRLQQMLLNLLGNAVRFTETGSVTLHVQRLSGPTSPALLRFDIIDTGIGIAPKDLQRIFKPFEQVGDARHRVGGTGLGLAICSQLARAMGSEIVVDSEPGRGSRFRCDLSLPLETSGARAAAAWATAGYSGRRRRVLVVDDVAENRAVLAETLRPLGFEVNEAQDGLQALQVAVDWHPDLILMDSVMPRLDGNEATRRLRQMPAFRALPIVAISAAASRSDRSLAIDAGANCFLAKPFDAGLLLDTIGELLALQWLPQQA